jgi:hypothetical protein
MEHYTVNKVFVSLRPFGDMIVTLPATVGLGLQAL